MIQSPIKQQRLRSTTKSPSWFPLSGGEKATQIEKQKSSLLSPLCPSLFSSFPPFYCNCAAQHHYFSDLFVLSFYYHMRPISSCSNSIMISMTLLQWLKKSWISYKDLYTDLIAHLCDSCMSTSLQQPLMRLFHPFFFIRTLIWSNL